MLEQGTYSRTPVLPMPDLNTTPVRLPAFKTKPRKGECFDCFCARLLIATYQHLKDRIGLSHKHTAEAMGLCRASLYARIRRAEARMDSCDTCQPPRHKKTKRKSAKKSS